MKIFFLIAALFLPALLAAQVTTPSGAVTDVTNIPLDQDNSVVAISRANHNTIAIAVVGDETDSLAILAYYTSDRGATWQPSRLPRAANPDLYPGIDPAPSIASDASGNLYCAYTTNGVDDQGYLSDSSGDISFASSSDAGKTWKNVTAIDMNLQYSGSPNAAAIIVDNSSSSSHKGRIYAVWDETFSDTVRDDSIGGLYISWSDNQGKIWTTPKLLGHSDGIQTVKTGKNGEVFVTTSDSSNLGYTIYTSTDGGQTFPVYGNPVALFSPYPFFFAGPNIGLSGLKGATGFAAMPYITFDVDLSTGRIHAVYGDYLDNAATLYYRYSDNNGSTWSNDQEISELSIQDKFFPSVSVDQKTHDAYVLFLSSESDPNNIQVAPYRLHVGDTSDKLLSPQFNPLSVESKLVSGIPPYIGDHTSCDAYDTVFAATWTQNRAGYTDGDAYAFVSTGNTNSKNGVPVMIHSSSIWLSPAYPNPSDGKNIFISYYLPHEMNITLDLYDVNGKMVKQLSDKHLGEGTYTEEITTGTVPPGTYYLRLLTTEGELMQKVVIR